MKKQLSASRRKEKTAKNKLRVALSKVKKLVRTNKSKLAKKAKEAKAKIAHAEAALYLRIAESIKGKARKTKVKKKAKKTVVKTAHPKKRRRKKSKR